MTKAAAATVAATVAATAVAARVVRKSTAQNDAESRSTLHALPLSSIPRFVGAARPYAPGRRHLDGHGTA